uniref:Uncharacterized protein n=1 Tax=Spongospora subterranea TaxID=70186 RepID=A0A0H5RBJ1_9EUKA|eukprot:CRZ05814.1 hypothetical protein [Spongospora subterranea]
MSVENLVNSLIRASQEGDVQGASHGLALLSSNFDAIGREKALSFKDDNGRTPLHWACAHGHADIAKLLISNGWSCNVQDEVLWSPLHSACSAGHTDVVKLLINNGADLNSRNGLGATPILYACSKGNAEIVKVLLAHDADPTIPDEGGQTPLHRCSVRGNIHIAELLLRRPTVNVNAVDKSGLSPLHLSCMEADKEMATELLKFDADPRLKDSNGNVPFFYAPNGQIKYLMSLVQPADQ